MDIAHFVEQWLSQLEQMLEHAEHSIAPITAILEASAGYTLFSLLAGVAADPSVPLDRVGIDREQALDRLVALRMRAINLGAVSFERLLDAALERRAAAAAQKGSVAP